MASFYSSVSSDGGMLPTAYLLNQKVAYSSSELPNNKDYGIQHSVSLSYPNHFEPETIGSRDEMMFIPPTSDPTRMHEMNVTPRYSHGNSVISDTHITDYHGLSLSLGSHVPSLVQLPLDLNQYTNSSFCSLLSSGMQPESQSNGLKNVQYLSFDLTGKSQDMENYGSGNNLKMSSKTTSFSPSLHQELTGAFCNSKYLKAAQDLLNEVVNIHKVLSESGKVRNFNSNDQDGSMGTDVKRDDLQDPNLKATRDLLPSERHDLQNKMTKLFSMLDEVDRTYKQYYHQMQVVVSSLDVVAGSGAAQPYTAVALQTISRQFRCLRDAIKKQIQEAQKSLGDQDGNSPGQGVLSRLRFVDQQLRQRKAPHQFGLMRQPLRPQRGLPENAVSVLRAWLFEHFLHPYPKDSEKSVLARQTGLSRSQVANWFINARVRLWKPMIEEMYREEFGNAEKEPKSSPQNAHDEIAAFDERRDEFLRSLTRPDTEMDASRAGLSYVAGAFQDNEDNFELWHNDKLLRW